MTSKGHRRASLKQLKQRLMGPAENALIATSQQHLGYMKVGEVLHLQGPYIPIENFISAVRRLQLRHPFLRSRLESNPAKPGTYLLQEDHSLDLNVIELLRNRSDHANFWREQWKIREKEPAVVGQGLAEFWLLQDPNDDNDDNSPREIVVICEHSICDGLSLSTVAHELLLSLSEDNTNMFETSLNWPITMEAAVRRTFTKWNRVRKYGKFIPTALYWRATSCRRTVRIPLTPAHDSTSEMAKNCQTEAFYGRLNKEATNNLLEKCRSEGVTMTSAIGSAVLCAISKLVNTKKEHVDELVLALTADTRQRCNPQIPNHDLSFHASATMAFTMPKREIPTTSEGMWKLAMTFGTHLKNSLDAGHIHVLAMMLGRLYQKNIHQPNYAEVPTCIISNWGRLPFQEQYGQWQLIDTTPFLNLILTVMPYIFVQTVNGNLTIGIMGSVPTMSSNVLEDLCNGTIRNLFLMIEEISTLRF
ncbi:unnamed protein product [Adineta ricciae]|uniref:Phthiocerol/phthiodiolone dimycocerosyl transferase C-terminal domain-containing protein n=1 Tax=Adineta ricciae TaxID=249248 RepID=A0A814FEN1_ADIRI|nr:unnamed protein product [Adineta ricciae]